MSLVRASIWKDVTDWWVDAGIIPPFFRKGNIEQVLKACTVLLIVRDELLQVPVIG